LSNVLHRPEIVREETRLRVRAEIARLGFVRNEPARQLRQGRSRTLDYVVLDAIAFGPELIIRDSTCGTIRKR
jgi:LacI family transcriptional regulator